MILPGFGNATRDYIAPFGNSDASLVAALQSRGFSTHVVPINRKDWFNVAKMLFSRSYWTGSSTTHPGYSWYLERVKDIVDHARESHPSKKVILVGHSAGGWLARAFLGHSAWKPDPESSTDEEPHEAVAAIVTLGTPHTPPALLSNIKDQTGGALTWVNSRWPGAYFAKDGVKYVAVGSKAVQADKTAPRKTLQGYSYGSYKQVLGSGHGVVGDAVVPLETALLDGAHHVVFDDVLHSMQGLGTFEEELEDGEAWYGSHDVVDEWLRPVVEAIEQENGDKMLTPLI